MCVKQTFAFEPNMFQNTSCPKKSKAGKQSKQGTWRDMRKWKQTKREITNLGKQVICK